MKPISQIDIAFLEDLDDNVVFQLGESRNLPPAVSGKAVSAHTLKCLLIYADSLESGAIFDLLAARGRVRCAIARHEINGRYERPWLDSLYYDDRSRQRETRASAIRYFVNEAIAL